MELLIYRYDDQVPVIQRYDRNATIVFWRPGIRKLKPPGKGWKYTIFSIYHWLGVFRNQDYGALFAEDDGEVKASMLIVPAHFQWPFMRPPDLQFTYVWTSRSARRQGWGLYILRQGIEQLRREGREFWYVTDDQNVASQRLAERAGFRLVGRSAPRRWKWDRVNLKQRKRNETG